MTASPRWGSLYPQSEDCLYLNVWRSADAKPTDRKPVMVWIHGGAFEIGGTAEPREEGTNFVAENPDVILVSIEYRLGLIGFLYLSHLPDGADYPDAQNLGLLDQMMALRWVHGNIAAFGGDPYNVTIFGQSAGGGSVSLLPLVEGSHDLITRVIAQSGSPGFSRSTEQAIESTNVVMEALGCTTVADLMKVDAEKLVEAGALVSMRMAPERDGKFLPLDTYEAYANGAAKDIAIMQGCTKDEFNYFIIELGEEPYQQWLADIKESKLAQLTEGDRALVESYCNDAKGEKSYEADTRLFSQIWFNVPFMRCAELQTMAGGRTYCYYFTVESCVPLMKSGHAIELAAVFNHPEETYVTGRAFDETFCRTMRKMWVQFAKTGDPSLTADVSPDGEAREWPLYDLEDRRMMVFDEFDVHVEKEEAIQVVDWERTYFLGEYYVL